MRRWAFDALQHPTHTFIKHAADPEKFQARTVYGESLGLTAPDTNHRGQVYRLYDSAGVLTALEYDFKGNLLARLQVTDRGTDAEGVTYYVYDGAGQRVRKVHVKDSTRKQRLYFGA